MFTWRNTYGVSHKNVPVPNTNLYYIEGTHLTMWTASQNQTLKIAYVHACVSYVQSIKRYDILSVTLCIFQDDANCRVDNNHVETLTTWEKCRTDQGVTAAIKEKPVWCEAPSRTHREIQLYLWTFVRHRCFMKYLLDKGRGECTLKGVERGMLTHAWVSRELLGCAGVQST